MPRFRDRADAGLQLAARLSERSASDSVIVALPRGGVIVGYHLATNLALSLDVIVARKLGAPFNPEFGIGAIAEEGIRVLNEHEVSALHISPERLQAIEAHERLELERRVARYRGGRPPLPLTDRSVVLVDDGLATGLTASAAIAALRLRGARSVILAVPVGPPDTVERLRRQADDLVCLHTPSEFIAVGEWYASFGQTTDEEVMEALRAAQGATVD